MSKDETDTHLRFGQGILIEGFRAEQWKGLLTVKGYADINAKYETYDDILYFKNYRDAIFQIIPAGNFEINDELVKGGLSEEIREKLKTRAKTEENQFMLNIDNKMNENIFFGSNVMFKHVDSECYLSGTIDPSTGDNGAFAVQVNKELSSSLIFKLEPHRSFEFEGMKIPFGSPVKIKNIKTGTYLTFENPSNQDTSQKKLNQKPIPSHQSFKIPIKKKSQRFPVFPAVLFSGGIYPTSKSCQTSDIPTPWTFKLHMKDVINDKLVQHDIGYLQHTQRNGVLIAFKNDVALKQWKDSDSVELSCYDCLWEIEKHVGENEYILRHLMSGMTLGFVDKEADGVKYTVPVLTEVAQPDELGTIDVIIAKKEGGEINSNSFVTLGKNGKYLAIAPPREQAALEETSREIVHEYAIVKEDFYEKVQDELEYERKDLRLSDEVPTHCFVIKEIDDETKKEVLFALSFHQTLISLISDLKEGAVYAEKKISYERMIGITKSLSEIKAFIKNCSVQQAPREQILPIQKRQDICKDLGMSQLLFQLLYYMKINKNDTIFKDSHNQKDKFQQLYNTCYQVIQIMIKDNYKFKIHVSKWIDFVIEDVISSDDEARLNTLKEILKGNQLVISNFIREKLIEHLSEKARGIKVPTTKYLQIFRSFCIVDKSPVTKNQTNIMKLFVQEVQGTELSFNFKYEKEKQLMIQASFNGNYKWRVFGDYYKNAIDEVPLTWKYLVEYINLLADLCYGRNKTVKNYLQKQFELNVLIGLLKDPSINDADVPVLRLIHYLYIEGSDYYPVLRVNIIQKYDQITKTPAINATEAYNKPWATSMNKLLTELVAKLKIDKKIKPQDPVGNTKLYTVLNAILTTIELGFWPNIQQLQQILKYSLNILSNDAWAIKVSTGLMGTQKQTNPQALQQAYQKIKQNMQKPSHQNLLVIDCKLMATRIIEAILDFELDIRIKMICEMFKELEDGAEAEKKPAELGEFKKVMEGGEGEATPAEESLVEPWIKKLEELPNLKVLFDEKMVELTQENNKALEKAIEEAEARAHAQKLQAQAKAKAKAQPQPQQPNSQQPPQPLQPAKPTTLSLLPTSQPLPPHPLPKTSINSILLQLSQYSDPKLMSHSLYIMKRIYDQRCENIYHFYDICIVESNSYYKLADYTLKRREKFFTLLDQNTHRLSTPGQANSYHNIFKEAESEADSGIMQDLFMLSELMKSEKPISGIRDIKTLVGSGVYELLSSERLINLSNQRQSNNKLYQKIIKSSQIHLLVLEYIRNCGEVPEQEISAKLLHLCFIFLTNIITNNQDNKLEMLPHIEPMKAFLPHNVGVIDFFREMYDNNKNMLYNEREVHSLTSRICEIINSLPETSFYRAKLLDFFRCLIFFNEKPLPFNQILILKIMQDDSYKNILINVTPDDITTLVKQFKSDNTYKVDQPIPAVCKMSAQLTYMHTFFQVMSALIQDGNIVNIGKLSKQHPFKFLSECIRQSKKCWPLRRNLQMYINKLYYMQPGLQCYVQPITDIEFDNYIYTLNIFIQIRYSVNRAQQFEAQVIENPVRFSYMDTYMYLSLEELLNSLNEMMYHPKVIEEMNKMFKEETLKLNMELAYKFLRIVERLGCIRTYFTEHKAVYIVSLIKHIQHHMRNIVVNLRDKVFQGNQPGGPSTKKFQTAQQQLKMKQLLIQKIFQGDIQAIYSRDNKDQRKNFPLTYLMPDRIIRRQQRKHQARNNQRLLQRLKQIFLRKKLTEGDMNLDLNKRLYKTQSTMRLSDHFQNYLRQQFIQVASDFSKINTISEEIYTIPYISRESYIKTIIDMNKRDPQALSSDLKIFFLRLLARFISEKNELDKQGVPIDEWDAKYWDGQEEAIESEQLILKSCGLGDYLCQLLSDDVTSNIELANEILLCGIAFMLGGFQTSQKSIVTILQQDADNKVFVNINSLISKLGDLIYKNNQKKQPTEQSQTRSFSTTTIDTYDYYSLQQKSCTRKNVFEPDDAKEEEFKRVCMSAYRRSFKFIQLLCENNNIQSKKLIREQKKEKEGKEKKLNSIDFIQVATNELRKMFQIMCKEILEIPVFILDFLLEVTQIPVRDNQLVLMRSTFFEDLCQMQNKSEVFAKGFQQSQKQALAQLYSKCVTIILSNFEGDQDQTFRSLDNKMQARFLTTMLGTIMAEKNLDTMEKLQAALEESKELTFSEDITRLLDVLTIFKKMEEKVPEGNIIMRYNEYKESDPARKAVLDFLEQKLLKIQITNVSGGNQILYFPNHPVFSALTGQLRDQVMQQVSRQTRRDKIVTLLKQYNVIKQQIEHSFTLKKQTGITEQYVTNIKMITSLLSVIITVYISVMYTVFVEYQEVGLWASPLKVYILRLMCVIQLGFSFYYGYLWLKSQVSLENLHSNAAFLQLVGFILVSILGTFYQPYFFCIHLLDIFSMIDMLKDIFAAIAASLTPICLVSLMGVAFEFIFCSVTFSNYVPDVYSEPGEERCTSVSSCIMDLYVSSVIAETTGEFQTRRAIYDLIYITFFGLLFGNIVSGIILTVFAAKREAKEELIKDKSNFCFICNKSRDDIEKSGSDFKKHIETNHFLWNYVFYVYVLKAKDQTDYTGIQYYISEQLKDGTEEPEVNWLPNSQSSSFDPLGKTEEILGELEAAREEFDAKTEAMNERIRVYEEE